MDDTDSHQVGGVLSFEEVEQFVFEISVGWRVDVESFPRPGAEVGEGVPRVGGGPLHLEHGGGQGQHDGDHIKQLKASCEFV